MGRRRVFAVCLLALLASQGGPVRAHGALAYVLEAELRGVTPCLDPDSARASVADAGVDDPATASFLESTLARIARETLSAYRVPFETDGRCDDAFLYLAIDAEWVALPDAAAPLAVLALSLQLGERPDRFGPVAAEPLPGSRYDARLEDEHWAEPGAVPLPIAALDYQQAMLRDFAGLWWEANTPRPGPPRWLVAASAGLSALTALAAWGLVRRRGPLRR